MTSPLERKYNRVARFYDVLDRGFERRRYRPIRPRLFHGLTGRILDAGVGTGCNMPFYPAGASVTGVDLSQAMLKRAEHRKHALGLTVELRHADIRKTDFSNGTFDAAVATFLFCVLAPPDQTPALIELKRIVRPGGEIRLLEYVYSARLVCRLIQRLWLPWMKFAYGAGFDRETTRHVREAGLILVNETFVYADMIKMIVARVPDPGAPA